MKTSIVIVSYSAVCKRIIIIISLLCLDVYPIDIETEEQNLTLDLFLTEETYDWFDFFKSMVKHFITHVENALVSSVNLTVSLVNSITATWSLIRDMMITEEKAKIFDFLSKDTEIFSTVA